MECTCIVGCGELRGDKGSLGRGNDGRDVGRSRRHLFCHSSAGLPFPVTNRQWPTSFMILYCLQHPQGSTSHRLLFRLSSPMQSPLQHECHRVSFSIPRSKMGFSQHLVASEVCDRHHRSLRRLRHSPIGLKAVLDLPDFLGRPFSHG